MAVFVYDTADNEMLRLDEKSSCYSKCVRDILTCVFKFRILYTIVVVAVFLIIMYIAMQLVLKKKIPQASFVAVFIVTFTTMGQMMQSFSAFKTIQHTLGVVASSSETVNKNSIPNHHHVPTSLQGESNVSGDASLDSANLLVADMPEGDIELREVTYRTVDGRTILDNVNVTFQRNKRTAIVGRVGSGKSTIARLLLRLDRPSSGDIIVGQTSIYAVALDTWRKNVAFVPQTPRLMDRTLRENLMYGGTITDVDKAVGILKSMGMDDTSAKFKERMDESVGKGGNKLSGGQRQMVWLLRAMMSDAPVIVMDEPTSALDYTSRDQVVRFITTALKNKTLIIITHDQSLLSKMDVVMEVKDRKIMEKSGSGSSRTPDFGGYPSIQGLPMNSFMTSS